MNMDKKSVFSEISELTIDWKFIDAKIKFENSNPKNYFVSNELIEKNNHWCIDMFPKAQAMSEEKCKKKSTAIALRLSLKQKKANAGPVEVVYYEISILDKNGEVFRMKKSKNTVTFDPSTSGLEKNDILTDSRGWLNFYPTSEIEKNWDKLLTDNGELVLKCKFQVKQWKFENNEKKTKVDEIKIIENNQNIEQQNIKKNSRKRKINENININEAIIDLTYIEDDAFQAAELNIEQNDGKNNQQKNINMHEINASTSNTDDTPQIHYSSDFQNVPINEQTYGKNEKQEKNKNKQNNEQNNETNILRIEPVTSTFETVQGAKTLTYNNIDESEMLFISHDIKIKCRDNTELNTHKEVLAKHSDLLKNNFEENENIEVIDMTDFDPKVVKEMLLFIYWGKIKDIEGNFLPLLRLAKMFRIDSLKEFCSEEYTKAYGNTDIPLKQLNPKVEELDLDG